ncbi:MAG: DUF6351 family protein, partial [Steroidobacteraceae bacterium]
MLRSVLAVLLACVSQSALADAALEIRTLSSRPDLVSGGDALVEVRVPTGTQPNELVLTLNDKDVSGSLSADPARGSFVG